jgi:molybdopterin-biosynthesis enzyme MoeA-like protein
MLRNPEGVAPGCVLGNVYVLAGVPGEMKAMFDLVRDDFGGQSRYVESVRAAEPESQLLGRISELQSRFDVTVGSYPGETVRLRIEGTDPEVVSEAADWVRGRVDAPE